MVLIVFYLEPAIRELPLYTTPYLLLNSSFNMSTEVFTAHNVEHMSKHYVDRTRIVVGVFYPLAVTAVALRFIGRKISKNKIWWDDVLALLGMVRAICMKLLKKS